MLLLAVVPMVLVGNKKDVKTDPDILAELAMEDMKVVKSGDARLIGYFCHFHAFLECSAKRNIGVREVFEEAVEAIFAKKEKTTSCFH